MKQWKKTVATVLGLIVGLSLCKDGLPLVKAAQTYYVSYDNGSDSNVGTSKTRAFKTLKKAVSSAEAGDAIRILDTLYLTNSLNIAKEVTIGRAANMTDYMIVVESGATLTLRGDVTLTGRKSSVEAKKAMIKVKEGGTLDVKGKAVLKNNHSDNLPGGAVHNFGTMNISGNCVFKNNTTGIYGGGAICNEGTLNISGGTIESNEAGTDSAQSDEPQCGGGVLNEGDFYMSGGTIKGNTSIGSGGGVHNALWSSMELSGGTISNNTSQGRGGGICCYGGTLTMTAGTISDNCAAGGGGIHFSLEDTTLGHFYSTISGGTISRNSSIIQEDADADGMGGGISIRAKNVLYLKGGSITDNSCVNSGGGIRVGADGTVYMQDNGPVIANNVADKGGGIQVREDGWLEMLAGVIKDNEAKTGGGIHVRGRCEITGGSVLGNTATKGNAIAHNGELFLYETVDFDEADDIYLSDGKYVAVPGTLNNKKGAIVLTPSTYTLGRICVRATVAGTKASDYKENFVLAEKSPYILRPGDYLATASGVNKSDLIVSRGYDVTYNANIEQEVSNLPASDTMYWKETYAISSEIPVWSELSEFEEWNTKADGSGTSYHPGDKITMPTDDLSVYAQWTNLPPEITARNSYVVEDEIDSRLTKSFLKSYGQATDPEEGDISAQIKIANWEEIQEQIKQPYTEEELNALERRIEVVYKVEDSCGATAETKASLIIFLLEEETDFDRNGYVRFLAQEYIDGIAEDTSWGSEERKAYLKEILERDTSGIEWEN